MTEIKSPVIGKVKEIKTLNDGVFSEKMMGDGVAIQFTDKGEVFAPISGKLVTVFPTGHAYGIEAKDGTQVLVHIGVDTVNLNGEGFNAAVKQGKKIKQGKLLCTVDLETIKSKVPTTDVALIVLNESSTKITKKELGQASTNKTILELS